MDQVKFVKDSLSKFEEIWSAFISNFLKAVFQTLLSPLLNTLIHIKINLVPLSKYV